MQSLYFTSSLFLSLYVLNLVLKEHGRRVTYAKRIFEKTVGTERSEKTTMKTRKRQQYFVEYDLIRNGISYLVHPFMYPM